MRSSLCLAFAFVMLFWIGLGGYPLAEPDEARNGEIVREIVVNGNWFPPTVNGKVRYQKPPLYYWVSALFYRWFGSFEFAVRLSSALSATLLVVLLYLWGNRWWRDDGLSSLIFASSLMVFAYSRIGRMEMLLTLLISLSVWFFWLGLVAKSWFYQICGVLFLSLGFLTKGPVAVLFVGSALLPVVIRRSVPSTRLLLLFVLFLIFTIPVFIFLEVKYPGYCKLFFWKENVLRYATDTFHRGKPFYYFIPVLIVGLFPWTLSLGKLLHVELSDRKVQSLLSWVVLPILFFSFSKSKLPHYILPVFPAVALLLGSLIGDVPRRLCYFSFILYITATFVIFPWACRERSLKELASKITGPYPVYSLDDRFYSLSLYLNKIAPKVKLHVLQRVRGKFWLVYRKRKKNKIKELGCLIKKRVSIRGFEAVLLSCSPENEKPKEEGTSYEGGCGSRGHVRVVGHQHSHNYHGDSYG